VQPFYCANLKNDVLELNIMNFWVKSSNSFDNLKY
jgi:hypothetical protein